MTTKNIGGFTRLAIASIMKVDPSSVYLESNLEEDFGMDDTDIETVLLRLEKKFETDLIDFFDHASVKTVGQLIRFVKGQVEV
jgi:acyl carrier protein